MGFFPHFAAHMFQAFFRHALPNQTECHQQGFINIDLIAWDLVNEE
jgi:hypothetical protein